MLHLIECVFVIVYYSIKSIECADLYSMQWAELGPIYFIVIVVVIEKKNSTIVRFIVCVCISCVISTITTMYAICYSFIPFHFQLLSPLFILSFYIHYFFSRYLPLFLHFSFICVHFFFNSRFCFFFYLT